MTGDGYLLLAYTRCNAAKRLTEWAEWYDRNHLPAMLGAGADAITRFELTQQPVPGMPSIGFSHIAVYEFRGAGAEDRLEEMRARGRRLRDQRQVHPNHCLINVDILKAHGALGTKSLPSADLEGHIFAYVMPNQSHREDEWDSWYDSVHLPDMMQSQAFRAGSRWRRSVPAPYGANDLTLYDVAGMSIEAAVERSAGIMPSLTERGRKLDCHVGAMTFTVRSSGQYGGAGLK